MKKIINRNNRCIWDSDGYFQAYVNLGRPNSGLVIFLKGRRKTT